VVGVVLHRQVDGPIGRGGPQELRLVAVDHSLRRLDVLGGDLADRKVDAVRHHVGQENAPKRKKNQSRQEPLADPGLFERLYRPPPQVRPGGLQSLHPSVTSTAAPRPGASPGPGPLSPSPPAAGCRPPPLGSERAAFASCCSYAWMIRCTSSCRITSRSDR